MVNLLSLKQLTSVQSLLSISFFFTCSTLSLFSITPEAYSAKPSQSEIEKQERRLKEIRQDLKRSRQKEKELIKKEKGILKQLKELEEALELSLKRSQHLQEKEGKLQLTLAELDQKIEMTERDLARSQEILQKRLRSIYIHGRLHFMELLLSSRTFSEGSLRVKYWNLIAEQDRRITEEIRRLNIELEKERGERGKDLRELQIVSEDAKKEETQRKEEKREREKILSQTQKEKRVHTKASEELQKVAQDLEKLINELEKKKPKKETYPSGLHPFKAIQGKLPWPVKGKVISSFGLKKHPIYKTSTQNNGIDIQAPIGEPVYTIGQGKVVYADRFMGYGKILLIDHGGGFYTLYGHLSDYSMMLNDAVEEGEQIGWVGDTGSLEGSKLHFEFRKEGKPVDPLLWLKKK